VARRGRPCRGGVVTLIALEEHYAWDPASDGNVVATWLRSHNRVGYDRLYDRGPLRLEQMDAAGIDFQILSLFDPGVQDETDVARAIDHARRAPIYLHPTTPHPAVMDAWFAPYVDDGMHLASWGFAAATDTHVLRLIYSGLFDRFRSCRWSSGTSVKCCRSPRTASTATTGSAVTVRAGCSGCRRTICGQSANTWPSRATVTWPE
jgi:hypothetical protein